MNNTATAPVHLDRDKDLDDLLAAITPEFEQLINWSWSARLLEFLTTIRSSAGKLARSRGV
ncbi:hypothetical protein [Amycolatopsis azurea]|uniref:Uncharacterized protein n=1 Tax=Amycolatopsis azurea DSM 43854 TaxID=1238180 RepID=M2PH34_9PSEU|nr:hypothetical protein [Amycolatopsis azurea]EMD23723.1 hypothetical protein C791_6809 [Amycolatopsis azurea DSM 43854]OOC02950.1 hypothetical protein B0293_28645 [Amycolatopsis azurea DSM 43854]